MKSLLLLMCLAMAGVGVGSRAEQVEPKKTNVFCLDDLTSLTRLSSPQISPDGKSVAVLVVKAQMESNHWQSVLELVDVASGKHRPLTPGRTQVSYPRWSPTGDRRAFLAPPIGSGKDAAPQIFVLPMNGGEATQITKMTNGVQHFSWSPDGKEFAFATEDERPNKKEIEKGDDAFEVGNDDLFVSIVPMPVHIWIISSEGGSPRRLTSGSWSLPISLPPSPPASPLSWSPDGREIAFTRQETAHSGDQDKSTLRIVDVATGVIRAVTDQPSLEGFPSFSKDGKLLSYWQPRDRDPNNVNDIFIASAAGGVGTNLTSGIDRCFYQNIWMPDGKSLLTGGNDGAKVALWEVPLQGKARRLDLGKVNPAWSFWIDVSVGAHGEIAFPGSAADQPTELYYCENTRAKPRRLTDFNSDVASLDLGKTEVVEWIGPDDFHENGMLTYPPGYRSGTKLPLVLVIHGGPQAASITSFSALSQLIAAHGYLVFSPNYRGSDNLGNGYQRAIFNDAGDGPGRDVMAGIEAVKAKGIVDESRIAVSGWSYGGYMTTWMIGHYTFWKTAIAGAAVTDLTDELYLSDNNLVNRYSFPTNAMPWTKEGEKLYREQSPITYASKMRTPTLIMTDTGDARVPPTQSLKLYHALREQGISVSMVAYPVPGHFPGDPLRTRDVYRRWVEWLDKYLSPDNTL